MLCLFGIDFSFLKSKTKEANIKIVLTNDNKGTATLYYLFNGFEFQLIKTKYSNTECEKFITINLINKPKKVNAFLLAQIAPYRFTTKWGQPKEIEKFSNKNRYKVGILDFKNHSILVFEEFKTN